ncbi:MULTISPECIES: sn-glycerol-3-phosphate ABC transporter ATP-binding protein UgpC [Rhizobium/Agrobacterium group]|uniref:Sn-glycerol-3-phosphate ABC transporter ATP-binding protein UgpC n=2 Tax=Neorhizobium TaxID=1525371 RepID=A0ABV0M6E0_9HYPH|nr:MULTISPECIES: sn-glycerol-3-phosphate ABC transporter ATP-binding protein UgpC [Rhizobium/Agrobacterium group]KGD87281.1 ABC transporter ATP-binding protein [Rhizobium sp. YS-1r]MCC2612672.1 sn-glycerol-3-phosphate ABC transporter ATP-binding protein UgpC [Neorhizobium petrolearium]WGI67794.1 sn-glycerol-3-phosphate ABC transporter ATP-binding protein UgpC [Neorhizobium petrolearium]
MTAISLKDIRKSYGSLEVISSIDLDIERGEFVVFVGPSGCGKSTLLRMIAGLEGINSGDLMIGDVRANDVPPSQRGIAMVFQSYALYPHMDVYDNLAFSLKIAHVDKAEIDRRVRLAAEMLQLEPYLKRRPRQLSGGQRQRVAIGRAIVREAEVFLFDEPLSNLDAALRVATRIEIARLKERLPDTTMIYVTHDQVEAMTLADRIVVLNGGRIEQVGRPVELYDSPRNVFVAGFIGSPAMNFLPVDLVFEGDVARIARSGKPLPLVRFAAGGRTGCERGILGIRPEHMRIGTAEQALISGPVDLVEHLGEVTIAYLRLSDDISVTVKFERTRDLKKGEVLHLTADPADLHAFDQSGLALARPGGVEASA